MPSSPALPHVKSTLKALLTNKDYKVVALTGDWGTGKTFLWKEIERELATDQPHDRSPVYISAFGVQKVKDLRLRLLKHVSSKDKSVVQKVLSTVSWATAGLAQRLGGVSLEDIVLTWLPDMLKGRLVVIDDVERKSASLGIDEFLGFIDEQAAGNDVRVLLLLNEGRLGESAELWAKLREKVIDAEVVLKTTAGEAFGIAVEKLDASAGHMQAARAALETLSITNIRVIKRVLNIVVRIFEEAGQPNEVAFDRWVPSTVLMSAAHYRALEDPPTFQYLRNENSWERLFRVEQEGETPQHQRWNKLLSSLHINSGDAFEELLESFLKSGLLDANALKGLFKAYRDSQGDAGAEERRNSFLKDFYWSTDTSAADLLESAKALLPDAPAMAPPYITEMIEVAEELGDGDLAKSYLNAWTTAADMRPEYRNLSSRTPTKLRKLHPAVEQKLQEMYDLQNPPLSLRAAVEHLMSESGWSDRHLVPLSKSTPAAYEGLLQSVSGDRLADVVLGHLEWITRRANDPVFSLATRNFILAARSICASIPNSRIATILRRSFDLKGMSDRLNENPNAGDATHAGG